MREKKVVVPAPRGDVVAGSTPGGPASGESKGDFTKTPMVLTATSEESIALLTVLLEEVRKLGSEAAQRVHKSNDTSSSSALPPSAAPTNLASTGGLFSDAADSAPEGDPPPMSAKMSRWLKNATKNKEEAGEGAAAQTPAIAHVTDEDGAPPSGKMSRWMKRLNESKQGGAGDGNGSVAGEGDRLAPEVASAHETPGKFVERACAAVRESWAKGGGNMTLAEEWEKLKRERAGLEALIAMVTAVKETPEKVTGLSPPDSPRRGGGPAASPYSNGNGMRTPSQLGTPAAQIMQRSVPNPAFIKPDPDALLAEFLAARREERVKETAQMIHNKKNPKKKDPGAGWRAGSPMASAATPTAPVRISLSRAPPPPPPPPLVPHPPAACAPQGRTRGTG